jgi:hypothetical protein
MIKFLFQSYRKLKPVNSLDSVQFSVCLFFIPLFMTNWLEYRNRRIVFTGYFLPQNRWLLKYTFCRHIFSPIMVQNFFKNFKWSHKFLREKINGFNS